MTDTDKQNSTRKYTN